MIRSLLTLTLLAASPIATLSAQEAKSAEVEFRVTRFDPADRPSPEFRAGPEGGEVEVVVPLTYIAGPYKAKLRDERFLDLWSEGAETPEFSIPIAAAERKDLLLLFVPTADSYRILKVRTPLGRIRGGDRYLVNATDSPLAIKPGDAAPIYLDPGKSDVVRSPGGDDVATLPILVSLKKDEEWKLSTSETWVCDPRFRKYLFAYPHPRTGHLTFHTVSERL